MSGLRKIVFGVLTASAVLAGCSDKDGAVHSSPSPSSSWRAHTFVGVARAFPEAKVTLPSGRGYKRLRTSTFDSEFQERPYGCGSVPTQYFLDELGKLGGCRELIQALYSSGPGHRIRVTLSVLTLRDHKGNPDVLSLTRNIYRYRPTSLGAPAGSGLDDPVLGASGVHLRAQTGPSFVFVSAQAIDQATAKPPAELHTIAREWLEHLKAKVAPAVKQ